MKYQFESTEDTVAIEVTEIRGKQHERPQLVQQCQEGRCPCPAREYSTPGSLEIASGEGSITPKLESKPGAKFGIDQCRAYAQDRVLDGD